MKYGYARVSTADQNVQLQHDALLRAGCDRIFTDQGVSGTATERAALDDLLAALQPGDQVVVWKLDRLGRSLHHLIELVTGFGEQGVHFASLSESIDTSTAGGRLVFHMMGALAEFERALISERTCAGLEAAKRRGALLGRPKKLVGERAELARRLIAEGKSHREVASIMRVSRATVWREVKRSSMDD